MVIEAEGEVQTQEATIPPASHRYQAIEAKTEAAVMSTATAHEGAAGGEVEEEDAATETELQAIPRQRRDQMAKTLQQHNRHRCLEVEAFLVIA